MDWTIYLRVEKLWQFKLFCALSVSIGAVSEDDAASLRLPCWFLQYSSTELADRCILQSLAQTRYLGRSGRSKDLIQSGYVESVSKNSKKVSVTRHLPGVFGGNDGDGDVDTDRIIDLNFAVRDACGMEATGCGIAICVVAMSSATSTCSTSI